MGDEGGIYNNNYRVSGRREEGGGRREEGEREEGDREKGVREWWCNFRVRPGKEAVNTHLNALGLRPALCGRPCTSLICSM